MHKDRSVFSGTHERWHT